MKYMMLIHQGTALAARRPEAASAFARALDLATTAAERRFLERRLAEVAG